MSNAPVVGNPASTPADRIGPPTIKRCRRQAAVRPSDRGRCPAHRGRAAELVRQERRLWESGPWGTSTQNSFIHRSTDDGLEFHVDSPAGLRPDPGPGGGDTDIVTDDQGNEYFVDLEALVNLGTSVSNDNGNNWRKNPAAVQNTAVDRQWYAVDNGTTSSAADNTIFLSFHETEVGTFIYSRPARPARRTPSAASSGRTRPRTSPLPLAGDATCAQIRFDPVYRNLYYACNEGNHIRMTIGQSRPGQRTGIAYHNIALPASPGGGGPGHLFPAMAVDKAGNVYAAWIDTNDNNVYYSYSTDQGTSWSTPVQVNTRPGGDERVHLGAGGRGRARSPWPGSAPTRQASRTASRTGPTTRTARPRYKWYGYVGVDHGANTSPATIAQQRFTEKPMHYGQICNQGIGCTVSGGDRQMADYFGFNIDQAGAIRIVYNDTTNQHNGAGLFETRQVDRQVDPRHEREGRDRAEEPGLRPDRRRAVAALLADRCGREPAAVRLHGAADRPAERRARCACGCRWRASPRCLPPPGKSNSLWLTRFQALSTGNSGEEAYRVFYVGAQSTGGLTPTFFAGTTTCTESTPKNCKVVNYPATTQITGHVCGNSLVADVPLSAFGSPVNGPLLYNVTAVSGGRNADNDLYADVDATRRSTTSSAAASPPRPADLTPVRGAGFGRPLTPVFGSDRADLSQPARQRGVLSRRQQLAPERRRDLRVGSAPVEGAVAAVVVPHLRLRDLDVGRQLPRDALR